MLVGDSIHSQTELFREKEIEQSVIKRFDYQVIQYPQQLAVKSRTQQITYHALNAKANQLAHALLALQPHGTEPIVLLLEQGIAFITGLLAVLKIGRIYVPLDASFPKTRNAYILKDAQATLIVTHTKNLASAHALAQEQYTLFNIDDIDSTFPSENLTNTVSPDALAYLIYTSGSTGQPKGVVQNHRNILHNCMLQTHGMQITSADRMSLLYSCSVMGAMRNIFNALLNGATLYPFNVKSVGLAHLVNWLIQEEITIYHSVATLFRHLVSVLTGRENWNTLRLIILGGEAVLTQDAESYKKHFPATCVLYTALGATETGTVRQFMVKHDTPLTGPVVPLGYAVADKEILLLDETGAEVKPGEMGEIAVRSRYLALGYWHKPDLTEQAFTHDTFDNQKVIYHTGDMGLMLADGCLLHKGRKDFQVKIRGYRIELSEIETILLNLPLKEVIVTAQENPNGEQYLVAYFVPEQGHTPTLEMLHHYLADKLPDYMLPAAFVCLQALPLTPNGKVNRLALPSPEQVRSHLNNTLVAPRSALEEKLVAIWGDILQRAPIGIYDNFFQLGGHSLLAAQTVLRINNTFTVELPLSSLFQAPTIVQLAEKITQLMRGANQLTIPACSRKGLLPLSFTQQRVWFLEQLAPGTSAYHMRMAFRMTGQLNIQCINKTITYIVKRHEILRTVFTAVEGQPRQIVIDNCTVDLPLIKVPPPFTETRIQHLLLEAIERPFDLEKDKMLRACLFYLTPTDHILLLVLHHIASDGWSTSILFRELSIVYEAFLADQPSPLSQLPIQYGDFAVWQRQWLTGATLDAQLTYWKHHLADAPDFLPLPTDYPRPVQSSFQGAAVRKQFSRQLLEQLTQLALQQEATLFMVLLAAFAILLGRHSGYSDIVIGTVIANRNVPETENLIGFFVNTLALRIALNGNFTFYTLLEQVKQVALDAYAHQDIRFEKLVEELNPKRDLSYHPIFQVLVVLDNMPRSTFQLGDLTATQMTIPAQTTKFDLNCHWLETQEGLRCTLSYRTDLFKSSTVKRLLDHFQTLLEDLVARPSKRISRLHLLTQAERDHPAHATHAIQPTHAFPSEVTSISARFEQQVTCYPHHIAVKTQRDNWTYQFLSEQVNQLATILLQKSSTFGERVALLFEHDAPMLVGILATLKAGKIYVPLDPHYPIARLNYLIQDSQASYLLTQEAKWDLATTLTTAQAIEAINIDKLKTVQTPVIWPILTGETIAYILYTSGSTGEPKGVFQNHRNVLYFIRCYTNNLHITAQDRLSLLGTYSFDSAVVDIFAALLNGATLYPFNLREPESLVTWLQQTQITIYHSTPTIYRYLLQSALKTERFPTVRYVVLGGEVVKKEDVTGYQQHFQPPCLLVNLFGQTESTITFQNFIGHETLLEHHSVPVGYPIPETELWLLDEQGERTELYGEIAVRSAHVALGYWQRKELTQAAFSPDPQGGQKRLYRTGDLGRLLPDGSLEFLGRKDFQVKIRGVRIELGETEAMLLQHPAIKESTVVVKADTSGDRRLMAYVVVTEAVTFTQIRAFLKERLPEFMLPAGLMILEKLPLTATGKINHRALPEPEIVENKTAFVAPHDRLELQLQKIWQDLLKIESIGVNHNFFELGGHSLLAIQVLAKLRTVYNQNLSVLSLFQAPTIAQLAATLRQQAVAQKQTLIVIKPQGTRPPLFFIGSTNLARLLATQLEAEQPVYGLNIFGLQQFNEANPVNVKTIAKLFIEDIQSVQPQGPYNICGYCGDVKVAFEIAQQLQAQGQSISLLAFIDALWTKPNRWHRFYRNLLKFGYLTYLSRIIDRKLRFKKLKLKLHWNRWKMQWYHVQKIAIPLEVQQINLVKEFRSALGCYTYQSYSGPITFFLSSEWYIEDLQRLGSQLADKIEIYEIPGYHDTLFVTPQLEILGKQLSDCLNKLIFLSNEL